MAVRVLLVDDDAAVRAYLRTILDRLGCETVSLNDVPDAIQELNKGTSFDHVVSDFQMPNGSGLEVLQAAREQLPKATLTLITGGTLEIPEREALRELAATVLPKPVTADQIRGLVDSSPARPAQVP